MSSLADQPQRPYSSGEAIQELSEEQCEVIKGGASAKLLKKVKNLRRTDSAPGRVESAPFRDSRPASTNSSPGASDSDWSAGSFKEFKRFGTREIKPS
jgi:hypothetical protein